MHTYRYSHTLDNSRRLLIKSFSSRLLLRNWGKTLEFSPFRCLNFALHRRSFLSTWTNEQKHSLNGQPQTPQPQQRRDAPIVPSRTLDPSIINAILGPDDATLMLDSMKAIRDVHLPLDDRYPP